MASNRLFLSLAAGFLLLAAQALAAEIPAYLRICGRRNPEIAKCVIDSVTHLKPKLRVGIPELHVPALEPLEVEEVPLSTLPDFTALAKDVRILGISGFEITHLKLDFDKLKIDIEVTIPRVQMDADYDVDARILNLPIKEKGPISTVSTNVRARIALKFKKTEHKGKIHMYFTNILMKLVLSNYQATFQATNGKNSPITEAINSILVNNSNEIIESMTPGLEKAISTKILEVANKLCRNFTYDDLFPDRV